MIESKGNERAIKKPEQLSYPGFYFEGQQPLFSGHFLQFFQRTHFNSGASWLGFEHRLFTSEGVDAFARFLRWLLDRVDFQDAWQHELTWTFRRDVTRDDVFQMLQHFADFFTCYCGDISDFLHDLALVVTAFYWTCWFSYGFQRYCFLRCRLSGFLGRGFFSDSFLRYRFGRLFRGSFLGRRFRSGFLCRGS